MHLLQAPDDASRQLRTVVIVIGLLGLVLLGVFLLMGQLLPRSADDGPPGRSVDDAAPGPATGPGAVSGRTGPSEPLMPGDASALGYPAPTAAVPRNWRSYRDPGHGFQLQVPEAWRSAVVEPEEPSVAIADHDVTFEDPVSGARLAVSVWEAAGRAPFSLWVAMAARGMRSIDGQMPTNALIGGQPALVVWSPGTPTSAPHYSAFLAHGDWYYRVSYSAVDGGSALSAYLRSLATLSWQGEDSMDTIPRLPLPAEPYYPSSRLFGQSG